jgi:hypothetical protein
MKITLRKMRSSPLGGGYAYDFFTPLQFEQRDAVVSFTVNSHSSQYFNIQTKYGIAREQVDIHEYDVVVNKKVVLVFGKPNFSLVPATFAANKTKITAYANQLCSNFRHFKFVHFTHFGFLKTQFPKAQIKKILDVFLVAKNIDCELCWDIDEKFHAQMKELLESCIAEHQINQSVNSFDAASFTWDEAHSLARLAKQAEARELARLEWENLTNSISTNHQSGNQMTFSNIEISSGASGSAGEYYALSFLIRGGMIACQTPAGTATYDLITMSPNAEAFVPVQVKTIRNANRWLLADSHETAVPNLVFCFVQFTDSMSGTRIFFVPANVVSEVITISNQIYLALPGRNGIQRRDSTRRTLEQDFSILTRNVENPNGYLTRTQIRFLNEHSLGWLDVYENNLEIFNT